MEAMAELVQSSDSLILREVLKLFSDSQCGGGFRQIFQAMVSGLGKVAAMFVIQYYLKHTDKLPSLIFSLFKTCFYKRLRLDMSNRKLPLYVARRFEAVIKKDFTYNCFPLTFYNDNEYGVVEYLPGVHTSFYKEIEDVAQKEFEESQSGTTICQDLKGKDIKPKKLFPSKNYCYLDDVVSSYFKVAEMTEIYATKGILIDGEPGLGKTGSIEYLASLNKYGRVIKIDMTNELGTLFAETVEKVKQKSKESLIVLFDELDKYISHFIRTDYEKKRSTHDPKKGGVLPTWSEHVTSGKEKFLFELLSLLENSYFDKGAIFIFCSNNFDTIFDGVDPRHFESLEKRFLPLKFHRCECEELKDYIRYYNGKFVGSKWHREEEVLERELDRLRDNISIPYRDISDLNISSCYRVEDFIDAINNWHERREGRPISPLSDLFAQLSSDVSESNDDLEPLKVSDEEKGKNEEKDKEKKVVVAEEYDTEDDEEQFDSEEDDDEDEYEEEDEEGLSKKKDVKVVD